MVNVIARCSPRIVLGFVADDKILYVYEWRHHRCVHWEPMPTDDVHLNMDDPQTRKTSGHALVVKVGHAIDNTALVQARVALRAALIDEIVGNNGEDFFKQVSGDLHQVVCG